MELPLSAMFPIVDETSVNEFWGIVVSSGFCLSFETSLQGSSDAYIESSSCCFVLLCDLLCRGRLCFQQYVSIGFLAQWLSRACCSHLLCIYLLLTFLDAL